MLGISTIFKRVQWLRQSSVFLFLVVMLNSFFTVAQNADTLVQPVVAQIDTTPKVIDTSFIQSNATLSGLQSWITSGHKITKNDFELLRPHQSSVLVFLWIVVALFLFVIIRLLYKRDFQELFQSLMNKQLATQINRNKGTSMSNFSLMLLLIAVVNLSVMTMYTLLYFYGEMNHYTIQFFIKLIFLFTFFLGLKVLVVNTLGFLFEEEETAESYVNDFMLIVKVLGIAVFPTVLMIYVASKSDAYMFVYLFLVIVILNVLIFVWRGLSTSIQMMYKSVYHFLLYVCTVEVLSVFLLIKLLTKIAS
jgi:hypothetical protein